MDEDESDKPEPTGEEIEIEEKDSGRFEDLLNKLGEKVRKFFFPDHRYALNIRLVAFAIALPALLTVLTMFFVSWKDWDYQPLYGRSDKYDVALVVAQLEKSEIVYRIHPDSGQVLVRRASLAPARMTLAAGGITPPLPAGKAIMESPSPLGTSHFMERNRYVKALEGELALTIISLEPVRNARVHLSLPEPTVFLRESSMPKASVYLELYAGNRLSVEQVEGILNLVSGSITNLAKKSVTIVDQFGNALSHQLRDNKYLARSRKDLQLRTELEHYLAEQVNKLLEPLLGESNFQVQVATDIDFSVSEETQERFNPDKEALKEEAMTKGSSVENDTGGEPGDFEEKNILGREEWSGQYVKKYDVNRLVSHVQHMPGRLQRLSVAVILNYKKGDSDEAVAWNSDELARITLLVQQAIGFDLDRGDKVTVDSLKFMEPEIFSGPWWTDHDSVNLVGYIAAAIVFFLAVLLYFFSVRQTRVRKIQLLEQIEKNKEEELAASGTSSETDESLESDDEAIVDGMPFSQQEGDPAHSTEEESEAEYESYVIELTENESLRRRITVFRALSRKYPERVSKVIERWLRLSDEPNTKDKKPTIRPKETAE